MEFPFVTLVGFLVISNLLCGLGVSLVGLISSCFVGEVSGAVTVCGAIGQLIALVLACFVFWGAPNWDILDFIARGATIGCAVGLLLACLLARN